MSKQVCEKKRKKIVVMSPGVNDGSRKTGTLPKSNRRNDHSREMPGHNSQQSQRSMYARRLSQHPNNLLDWQPVSERELVRSTKNSNTRSTSSVPSASYHDLADIVTYGGRQYNYTGEDCVLWHEMAQPAELRNQSPLPMPTTKPTNVDRMPDRQQVESRLNQIRDYIRVTTTMMESLSQSSDPRARTQHDKLSKMVDDLGDSETKLAKLLEGYRGMPEHSDLGENGEDTHESELRKKMEASQRKLTQLQEHQANLVGMQLRVQERLNEAREARQILLQEESQAAAGGVSSPTWENNSNSPQNQLATDAEALESQTFILKGKLAQLQNKKKQMDHLVAELQAAEISDRVSCSSENSKPAERDKAAELEILKAQLAHLKGLMEEATKVKDSFNTQFEPEQEANTIPMGSDDGDGGEEEADIAASFNSFDRNSEIDEPHGKFNNSKERLTVEQIQAVTREMREQQSLLQAARAELQRLKNSGISSSPRTLLVAAPNGSISPSSSTGLSRATDRKTGNNNHHNTIHNGAQPQQNNKHQLEQAVRKNHSQPPSVNRDVGWDSRRASNSHLSNVSTPNMWPIVGPPADDSHEHSVDGIHPSENLMDIGSQPSGVENGMNWWNLSNPPVTQLPQGPVAPAEYYRQMLMNSQAQQLQLMSTTMQQCCQLLWAQQRELQSMRLAMTQLQQQVRQSQNQTHVGVNENCEGYSNLSQSTRHLDNTLDATLPPSSSLPNLVSLPNPTSAHSHSSVIANANAQHHQNHHQQLNNQVPPGNRANNYWDNFRSYSRQNLLSGNPKTATESIPGPSGNASTTTNTSATSIHGSLVRDKRNREHAAENLSVGSLSSSDAQYSLNFQLQSNLQAQDREISTGRNNILSNDNAPTQQMDTFWEEPHSFRLVPESNEDLYCLRHLSDEMRDVVHSLVAANRRRPDYLVIILREIKAISEDHRLRPRLLRSLRALQDTQPSHNPLINNQAIDQTASESCQSSDEDSDVGARDSTLINSNPENQSLLSEFLMPLHSVIQGTQSLSGSGIGDLEFENGVLQLDNLTGINPPPPSGYNEDLAEADQSRPDVSNDQQISLNEATNEDLGNGDFHTNGTQNTVSLEVTSTIFDNQSLNDDTIIENSTLDRIPTRLLHH